MAGWLFTRKRVPSAADSPPFNPTTNPYKARRLWPPDFATMDETHKFRLEKRYRRRTQTAVLRPGWVKGVKIAQWTTIGAVLVYSLFFLQASDPHEDEPFGNFRRWALGDKKDIWLPQPTPKPHTGRIADKIDVEG